MSGPLHARARGFAVKSLSSVADYRSVVTRRSGLILAGVVATLSLRLSSPLPSCPRAATGLPWELVALLLVLAIGSDMLTVEVRSIRVSGSFLAIVLAMALLGPAPAAAISVASVLVDAVVSRRPWNKALYNVTNYAVFPLVGGALLEASAGDFAAGDADALHFALAVLIVFMLTNALNFLMVAVLNALNQVAGVFDSIKKVYFTMLPSRVRDGPAHRRRRLQLRPAGCRRGGPARRRPLPLPVPDPGEHPGLRARRGARAPDAPAGVAAGRPAHDGPADAVDARRHDRPPLRRRRPLQPARWPA